MVALHFCRSEYYNVGKLQAGLVLLELPVASSFPPSGPNYIVSFGSGLLYPPLQAFERDSCDFIVPLR